MLVTSPYNEILEDSEKIVLFLIEHRFLEIERAPRISIVLPSSAKFALSTTK